TIFKDVILKYIEFKNGSKFLVLKKNLVGVDFYFGIWVKFISYYNIILSRKKYICFYKNRIRSGIVQRFLRFKTIAFYFKNK
uniref:hypothetical protein n=1 Tax=Flavobacterium sp. TaxID=239 RepID=UPI00404924AB